MRYEAHVHRGLESSHRRCGDEIRRLDLERTRMVILSDLHRGRRDRGDDFLRSERAYNAALGYYLECGYTLVHLGDVEELWSCTPKEIFDAYAHTVAMEAEFHRQGRYLRFYGNHDEAWSDPELVEEHLHPRFPGLRVREGLTLLLRSGGEEVGRLFLAHGHQGTTLSDRHARWGRMIAGNVWRPLQKLIRQHATNPSHDSALRERHEMAMYRWAAGKDGLVLVTGHTHRPVFMSESESSLVARKLRAARDLLADRPEDVELLNRVAELRARLEWIEARGREAPSRSGALGDPLRPCFFNVGCCSFPDGDVTGLELAEEEIRLVKWPDDEGRPRPKVLASASLVRDVFPLLRDREPAAVTVG